MGDMYIIRNYIIIFAIILVPIILIISSAILSKSKKQNVKIVVSSRWIIYWVINFIRNCFHYAKLHNHIILKYKKEKVSWQTIVV